MNTLISRSRKTKYSIDLYLPLRFLDEQVFFPVRRRNLIKLLSPHLSKADSVLDVGSSCGRLARGLMDVAGCRIEGIDVHLQPHSYIPVHQYNGHTFPFESQSFDGVMMVDMLHHTVHPEQVLREAVRVSRRYLLIKDHYWDNRLDIFGLRLSDYIGNAPYGVSLPYRYLCLSDWTALFDQFGLRVAYVSRFRYTSLDPCKHLVVRLEKQNS